MRRSPRSLEEAVDEALVRMIGATLAPAQLSMQRRASMRARIMSRTADNPPPGAETIRSASIPWSDISHGVRAKLLKRDDKADVIIVLWKIEPGGVVAGHSHTGETDEECLVLEGEMLVGTHCVRQGELHIARRGAVHEDLTTRTGCVIVVRSGISPLLATLFPTIGPG
jgi:quercetin dioxygenase-like cupin family protein